MICVGLRDPIAQIGTWFICFIAVDVVLLLMHRLGGKERIQWDAADVLLRLMFHLGLGKAEYSASSIQGEQSSITYYVDMLRV